MEKVAGLETYEDVIRYTEDLIEDTEPSHAEQYCDLSETQYIEILREGGEALALVNQNRFCDWVAGDEVTNEDKEVIQNYINNL